MVRRLTSLVSSVLVVMALVASVTKARAEGPEAALDQKIAVWRFDALGIENELVARLETLFRMELARLSKHPLPTRREIERAVTSEQQNCTGEERCLAAIGKKIGVDVVVTGTVGAMGSSYVLNIKAVDVATQKQIKRIESDPLRGSPDDLIEGVRVAAYRLLAPAQLHGSIQVQTDILGAEVRLDDKPIGKTPLANLGVLAKQQLGKHRLRVQAPGYDPFEDEVDVHFQKVSQVEVRMIPSKEVLGTGKLQKIERKPFYTRTWFIVGVGVAAVLVGSVIGYNAGKVDYIDCPEDPACRGE
ncbi:MAG: PEGA domain-containing protein [Deltaproteobacteria bacterium]|nr:PEGA domain-containing protein [Deltaproteobacteria bacterium]